MVLYMVLHMVLYMVLHMVLHMVLYMVLHMVLPTPKTVTRADWQTSSFVIFSSTAEAEPPSRKKRSVFLEYLVDIMMKDCFSSVFLKQKCNTPLSTASATSLSLSSRRQDSCNGD
jgi:hypothetical protein